MKFLEKANIQHCRPDILKWNALPRKKVKWKRELWIKWLTTLTPVNCKDVRLSNILACYLTPFSILSIHPNNKVCQVTFLTSLRKNQFTVSRPSLKLTSLYIPRPYLSRYKQASADIHSTLSVIFPTQQSVARTKYIYKMFGSVCIA